MQSREVLAHRRIEAILDSELEPMPMEGIVQVALLIATENYLQCQAVLRPRRELVEGKSTSDSGGGGDENTIHK